MAEQGEERQKTRINNSSKIKSIYYDKNGEYLFYSDGSCRVKSPDERIAGEWEDCNYISQEQYQNLKISLALQGKGRGLETIEGFIDESLYEKRGGRVILLRYIEREGRKIPDFGKSSSILNKKPMFKQSDSETAEKPIEAVPLEETVEDNPPTDSKPDSQQ